jgi:membrane protein YdbS with pleckstrin-like domain
MKDKPSLGEDFRPSMQLRKLYYITISVIFIIFIIPGLFIAIVAPSIIAILGVPFLLLFGFLFWWTPKYYNTIIYRLTRDEMTWRRGVWFRNTGIVPYNRITNVDIAQGPVSRALGIASLKIQTAGYSAPNTRSSEIRIDGIVKFEEMRELIMDLVRGRKPVAVETYEGAGREPAGLDSRILSELVRIRKALEKK